MPDQIDISTILTVIPAIAAIGTAAVGLVDATKSVAGGISNVGFPTIRQALEPFLAAIRVGLGDVDPVPLIKANWLNGLGKDDQKTAVRNMLRLSIIPGATDALAKAVPNIDKDTLASAAQKLASGETLTDAETSTLGRLDAVVDARMNAAFERADQQYRNIARVAAGALAIVLSELTAVIVYGGTIDALSKALLVGIIAVPIAPIAKDITSAITTAANAFKAIKR